MRDDIIATGTVTVRSLATGNEWDTEVEVRYCHLRDDEPIEDAARRVARFHETHEVEALEVCLE